MSDITAYVESVIGSMRSATAAQILASLKAKYGDNFKFVRDDTRNSRTDLTQTGGVIYINYKHVEDNRRKRGLATAEISFMEVLAHELGHAKSDTDYKAAWSRAGQDKEALMSVCFKAESWSMFWANKMAVEARNNGINGIGVSGSREDLTTRIQAAEANARAAGLNTQSYAFFNYVTNDLTNWVSTQTQWVAACRSQVESRAYSPSFAPPIEASDLRVEGIELSAEFWDDLRNLPPPVSPEEIVVDSIVSDYWGYQPTFGNYAYASAFDTSFSTYVSQSSFGYNPIQADFLGNRQLNLSSFEIAMDSYMESLVDSGMSDWEIAQSAAAADAMHESFEQLIQAMATFASGIGSVSDFGQNYAEPTAPPASPHPYEYQPNPGGRDPGIIYHIP